MERISSYADLDSSVTLFRVSAMKDENVEWHHKRITSFWLAAVHVGEYLSQVRDPWCKNTKSLTFLISGVNI